MPYGTSPYRSVPAALVAAFVLLFGAGGPALVHLCAMDAPPAVAASDAEMPPCHDSGQSDGHGEMPMDMPAEDAPAPCKSEAQACCLSVAAVSPEVAVVAEAPVHLAPAVAAVPAFALVVEAAPRAPMPRDTGPPPAVRPHLALLVLLI